MAVNWHYDFQDEHTDFGRGGRTTDVVDVHFIVDTDPGRGTHSWVTIEAERYTPEAVSALIDEKVALIQGVAGL